MLTGVLMLIVGIAVGSFVGYLAGYFRAIQRVAKAVEAEMKKVEGAIVDVVTEP